MLKSIVRRNRPSTLQTLLAFDSKPPEERKRLLVEYYRTRTEDQGLPGIWMTYPLPPDS